MTTNEQPTKADITQPKTGNPVIIMVVVLVIAGALTYLVPAGQFARKNKLIVPGSYEPMEKQFGLMEALFGTAVKDQAMPTSLVQLFSSIPAGIVNQADLIFMVMFIGGMFGVLHRSGAIDAGLERALGLTKGNVYVLAPSLMIVFSFGSTFLGMAKEFLLVIPMVIAMTDRLQLSKVTGLAIVAIPVKVGYLASITNPFALSVAQPLVNVPVFSGIGMRVVTYLVMMTIGIAFVLWRIRREIADRNGSGAALEPSRTMSARQKVILITLGLGIAFMVYGSQRWHWDSAALSAYYLCLSIVFAIEGAIRPSELADSFVGGMKKVMIAAVLIGLAGAVSIVLSQAKILDTIVFGLVATLGQHGPYVSAYSMFGGQLLLDVLIPSTSGQAAVTMPIMGPVAQLVGVTPQTTVYAFLLGNGLTNVITPTSSGLLIFLATAGVGWGTWARYVWPLVAILAVVSLVLLTVAVAIGY